MAGQSVDGRAEFTAPLTELALSVENYEVEQRADDFEWLTPNTDIELPASVTHLVRLRLRSPDRSLLIRLLRLDGTPAADVLFVQREATSGACGGASDGPVGATAATGEVIASLALQHTASLWFQRGSKTEVCERAPEDEIRVLSKVEMLDLFRTGTLTVWWDVPQRL